MQSCNVKFKIIFLAILFFGIFGWAESSRANITLTNGQWSSTFNCADYNQYPGYPDITCDGLETGGNWVASPGNIGDKILSAANNSGGGGGKGYQHAVGDGTNNNGGGLNANFPLSPELWVRWYMKYPSGFLWASLEYDKLLYFHGNGDSTVPEFYNINSFRIYTDTGGTYQTGNYGWSSIMGGNTGDGQWHYYQVHLKTDTNGSNGIWEFWVDGTRKANFTNVNYGGSRWSNFGMMTNQLEPNNGGVVSVFWDDIAVSTTGYISPLSGGTPDITAPASPTGLTIN